MRYSTSLLITPPFFDKKVTLSQKTAQKLEFIWIYLVKYFPPSICWPHISRDNQTLIGFDFIEKFGSYKIAGESPRIELRIGSFEN